MSLLTVSDVTVRFGGIVALDGVNVRLNRGEVLGLIGPNGAGKTTLFNVISGVVTPDEGQVVFDGRSLLEQSPHERARLGVARTFQNLELWGGMTVLENLKVPIDAMRRRNTLGDALRMPVSKFEEHRADEYARATLHALELLDYESTLASDLSVGLQRRVEIARALCLRPRLLLLDEPAAGLNPGETEHLAELLTHIALAYGVSMVLVDHSMSLVMAACDYIYVLNFGKILARGKPDAIRNDPAVVEAYLGSSSETVRGAERAPERAPADTPLLEVEGLASGYGGLEVIRDVNLSVHAGETVAIIGANGAGKTTALRAVSGILPANRGTVRFDGKDITHQPAESIVHHGLLHVPQGRGLFPTLTVEEMLKLSHYAGMKNDDLTPAFDAFPILKERRRQLVGTLSGGQQQMLALARAVLARPKLLMVDEMSMGLAPQVVNQLFEWIATLRDEGIAVILVEQFVDSALAIADRAYVFAEGTVAVSGSAVEMRRDEEKIARSYLGTAPAAETARPNETVERESDRALLDELVVQLPGDLVRSLEERAQAEGRSADDLARELLSGGAS